MIESEVLGKHLIIEGFKNVKINNIDEFFNLIRIKSGGCQVQILDAELVADFEHIYFAVLNALRSFKSGLNISKNLAVEILLFVSGQDQIKKAIEILGVKSSSNNIAVVIVADSREEAVSAFNAISSVINGEADQSVIGLDNKEKVSKIINAFGISNLELEASFRGSLKDALKNILIERSALLITQR